MYASIVCALDPAASMTAVDATASLILVAKV